MATTSLLPLHQPLPITLVSSILTSRSPQPTCSPPHTPPPKPPPCLRACVIPQVLAGVADGLLPLEEAGEVLRDALTVLGCKEIKVKMPVVFGGAQYDSTWSF